MLLYLTSQASVTLDKLTPYIPQYRPGLTVAFIPTAGDIYTTTPWQDKDRDKLEEMGMHVIDVDLKDKNETQLRQELAEVDILFVAGGNTFYLLEQTIKSGFIRIAKELVEQGIIYIGSSAGSVLAGPTIEPVKTLDDPKAGVLDSFEGLGFVDFIVLPHYAPNDPVYESILKEYKDIYMFVPLTNDEAVLVTEEGHRIIS
jgi:dipeptidase E